MYGFMPPSASIFTTFGQVSIANSHLSSATVFWLPPALGRCLALFVHLLNIPRATTSLTVVESLLLLQAARSRGIESQEVPKRGGL